MKNARSPILTATLGLLFLAAGCVSETDESDPKAKKTPPAKAKPAGKPAAKPQPPAKTPDSKTPAKAAAGPKFTPKEYSTAKTHLATFCATCHGAKGKGDGLAALALNPKPRDWTDTKWHDSVTDEKIFKVIMEGGAANGLSPLMAPDLVHKDQPGVIHALVKLVRKFKGQ